ncbi:hypothetical protein DL771_003597 [Monosporascus sp. 5C6A]|nr:hypothetical protein DL771_003597 [Monosporascus sp. 5C6A]
MGMSVNCRDYPSGDDRGAQQKLQRSKSRFSGVKSMSLPYENYIGAVLNRKYRITFLCTNKDHLDIYSVTSLDGESFKAQAFKLSWQPDKLYSSRKRRAKRLKQSGNCTDDFEQGLSRYLISPAAPQKPQGQGAKQPAKPKRNDSSEHLFPGLGASGECVTPRVMESVKPNSRPKTYAEAASWSSAMKRPAHCAPRSTCVDGLSTSHKGARQRERRRKRREERRQKAAYLNGECFAGR